MIRHTTRRPRTHAAPALHWIFRRHSDAITCGVAYQGQHAYQVYVVPDWDASSSLVERFNAPTDAFLRHAEIARRLRDDGWVLTEHMNPVGAYAAA